MLRWRGLPCPPPQDDPLIVPLDCGLLGAISTWVGATWGIVGGDSSIWPTCCLGSFCPSGMKLPTTICDLRAKCCPYIVLTNINIWKICKKEEMTWTGDAAIRRPATQPPKTLPFGADKDTLRPPVLLLWPLFSSRRNEPDKDRISNLPWFSM